jgi:hypothetical protein
MDKEIKRHCTALNQDKEKVGVLAALPILALSLFPFIFLLFSHFSLIWRRLASPCTRPGGWKGVDRLTSPCRLKNIAIDASQSGEIVL